MRFSLDLETKTPWTRMQPLNVDDIIQQGKQNLEA
jgi:hypothetical protein